MATYTAKQIAELVMAVGITDDGDGIRAVAVALAESGGRTDAQGDVDIQTATWGPSVGLWQIRSLKAQKGTGGERDAQALLDPRKNAKSMYAISKAGTSWGAWSAFTNGSYKDHSAKAAVGWADAGGGNQAGISDIPAIIEGGGLDTVLPFDSITDPLVAVSTFLGKLMDPGFWKRIGLGVLGVAIVLAGLVLVARDLLTDTAGKVAGTALKEATT